jgi:hypothetical protein
MQENTAQGAPAPSSAHETGLPPDSAPSNLPPLSPGDRIRSAFAERPGSVVKVYADGSACILWDDGTPQAEGLGHERMPRSLLILDGRAELPPPRPIFTPYFSPGEDACRALLPGEHVMRFAENVESISGGVCLLLQILEQERLDDLFRQDCNDPADISPPMFSAFHRGTLERLAIASLDLLVERSGNLVAWAKNKQFSPESQRAEFLARGAA